MDNLDELLRSGIAEAAAESVQHPDFGPIEHRGIRRRRNRTVLGVAVSTAALALIWLSSARLLVHDTGNGFIDQSPPSSSEPADQIDPLRRDASMPLVLLEVVASRWDSNGSDGMWSDGRDVPVGVTDITEIRVPEPEYAYARWSFKLRTVPPPVEQMARQQRIVEYGVVVDADGDRDADCQIGINNDARKPGDWHTWVTNLRTGVTEQQSGPPYGYPIDFTGLDEDPDDPGAGRMLLYFLGRSSKPCDQFSDAASFYAWASVRDAGQLVAVDYAPDAAWLRMRF